MGGQHYSGLQPFQARTPSILAVSEQSSCRPTMASVVKSDRLEPFLNSVLKRRFQKVDPPGYSQFNFSYITMQHVGALGLAVLFVLDVGLFGHTQEIEHGE